MLQLEDLTIVGTLVDDILLCKKDLKSKEALQLILSKGDYHISDIDKFCKFTPFDEVENDPSIQRYYRDLIYRNMKDEKIIEFLQKYSIPLDVKNLNI